MKIKLIWIEFRKNLKRIELQDVQSKLFSENGSSLPFARSQPGGQHYGSLVEESVPHRHDSGQGFGPTCKRGEFWDKSLRKF